MAAGRRAGVLGRMFGAGSSGPFLFQDLTIKPFEGKINGTTQSICKQASTLRIEVYIREDY
ncbi:MAG: hypothetical protein WAK01_04105, partial [Methylocystis sp.]